MVSKLLSLTPDEWAEFDGIDKVFRTRGTGVTFYDIFLFLIDTIKTILNMLKNVFILNFGDVQFNLLYFLIGCLIFSIFIGFVFRAPSGSVDTVIRNKDKVKKSINNNRR